MKELSIEEKAKAYDGLIERLKDLKFAYRFSPLSDTIEEKFPELKESEDERIRKSLIILLQHFCNGYKVPGLDFPVSYKDMFAWLEKQSEQKTVDEIAKEVCKNKASAIVFLKSAGIINEKGELAEQYRQSEQKPTNEAEPKFKVGDWVVRNGETLQISGIDTMLDGTFHYWFTKGTWLSSKKMENAILWTIQDAKDGDVLVDGNLPFIFKKIDTNKRSYAYCGISVDDGFKIESNGESGEWTWMQDIKPATKEQRDTLEKAMADAGYTFDFEKKELKKIEHDSAWSEKYIADVFEKVGLAKIAREQSNDNLTNALQDAMIELSKFIPQPKQEWSEEDEYYLNSCITKIEIDIQNWEGHGKTMIDVDKEIISWLKSLKERCNWKPSKEQMEGIECTIKTLKYQLNCGDNRLDSLYNDLKKLRDK